MLKLKNKANIEKFVKDFYKKYGKMMSNLANEKNCISMTIHYQIEYETPKGEYEVLNVDFLGDPTVADDSYDDEFGTVKIPPYPILEEVKWNKQAHTAYENQMIEQHVKDNYQEIAKKFIKKYKDQ